MAHRSISQWSVIAKALPSRSRSQLNTSIIVASFCISAKRLSATFMLPQCHRGREVRFTVTCHPVQAQTQPGVWILGAPEDAVREAGLGVVVEYANQHRTPQWTPPPKSIWDYTIFGKPASGPAPTERLEMAFEKVPRGAGKFNSFTVNGKPYPHDREFMLKEGTRYRLTFRNRTDDSHPLHLHRHQLEIAEIYGKATSGVIKDTVVVPTYGRASVDFTANQPGPTLFHCHIQQHMDYGFKALLRYA